MQLFREFSTPGHLKTCMNTFYSILWTTGYHVSPRLLVYTIARVDSFIRGCTDVVNVNAANDISPERLLVEAAGGIKVCLPSPYYSPQVHRIIQMGLHWRIYDGTHHQN